MWPPTGGGIIVTDGTDWELQVRVGWPGGWFPGSHGGRSRGHRLNPRERAPEARGFRA